MTTWYITHKRESKSHITHVQAAPSLGTGGGTSFTREETVRWIKDKIGEFWTEVRKERGAKVEVVAVNGTEYLRTDANRIASDNLGSLPDF